MNEIDLHVSWEFGSKGVDYLLEGVTLSGNGYIGSAELDNGINLEVKFRDGSDKHGALYGPEIDLIIAFGTGIASSLVAAWLYDRLKRSVTETVVIKINRRKVENFSKEGIQRVIEEEISIPIKLTLTEHSQSSEKKSPANENIVNHQNEGKSTRSKRRNRNRK